MKKILSSLLLSSGFLIATSGSCSFAAQPGVDITMPTEGQLTDTGSKDNAPATNVTAEEAINDPLEPLNRIFFALNRVIDTIILKPVAVIYDTVLPTPVQNGIGNFIQNLASPIYFLNHALQGNPEAAAKTALRFFMNTTMGLGGILDAGTELGYPETPTGFADTLGVWGVDTGPYLMLPIIGPSSFRGASGFAGDYYSNPFSYIFAKKRPHYKRRWMLYTLTATETVHNRSKVIAPLDDLEKNSADYYASIRSIHLQQQQYKVAQLKAAKNKSIDATVTADQAVDGGKKEIDRAVSKTATVTDSPHPDKK